MSIFPGDVSKTDRTSIGVRLLPELSHQVDILGHHCFTSSVYGCQNCVVKKVNQVIFETFLECHYCASLPSQSCLLLFTKFSKKSGACNLTTNNSVFPLVMTNFTKGSHSWSVLPANILGMLIDTSFSSKGSTFSSSSYRAVNNVIVVIIILPSRTLPIQGIISSSFLDAWLLCQMVFPFLGI